MATVALSNLWARTERLTLTRPLMLSMYLFTGFCGVLAEQGFEKYTSLIVGATASGAAAVLFAYFLGFALGGAAMAALIKRCVLRHPIRVYGVFELLIGIYGLLFSYGFDTLSSLLGPLENPAPGAFAKLVVRLAYSSLLIVPAAALMGASFPLIAESIDPANELRGRGWVKAYALNLAGGIFAAIAGAYLLLPSLGVRGAFWLCFAIGSLVCLAAFFFQAPGATTRTAANSHPRAYVPPGTSSRPGRPGPLGLASEKKPVNPTLDSRIGIGGTSCSVGLKPFTRDTSSRPSRLEGSDDPVISVWANSPGIVPPSRSSSMPEAA
jgi:spermidine synthase